MDKKIKINFNKKFNNAVKTLTVYFSIRTFHN